MAKILCNYFGLSMAAEGKSDFVGRQAAAFLGHVQQDAERCAAGCDCTEDLSAAPEEIKREILRDDEVGALLSVVYVIEMVLLPDEGKRFYAAIGLVVAYLEIIGSALGVWAWTPELFGLSEANPPSGAVGGYAFVDGAAYVLATYGAARVTAALAPARYAA